MSNFDIEVRVGDLLEFTSNRLIDGCPRTGVPLRVSWFCKDMLEKKIVVDVVDEETGHEFLEFNLSHFKKWSPK